MAVPGLDAAVECSKILDCVRETVEAVIERNLPHIEMRIKQEVAAKVAEYLAMRAGA